MASEEILAGPTKIHTHVLSAERKACNTAKKTKKNNKKKKHVVIEILEPSTGDQHEQSDKYQPLLPTHAILFPDQLQTIEQTLGRNSAFKGLTDKIIFTLTEQVNRTDISVKYQLVLLK